MCQKTSQRGIALKNKFDFLRPPGNNEMLASRCVQSKIQAYGVAAAMLQALYNPCEGRSNAFFQVTETDIRFCLPAR